MVLNEKLIVQEADHFEAIPGHGIVATVQENQILVGTRKLMEREHISVSHLMKNKWTNTNRMEKQPCLLHLR